MREFAQRLTLLHRDTDAPLVLVTAGYFINASDPGLAEPAALLLANQLSIEHRFFVPSRPEPADWATLTITQAASDHHRVAQAFKAIYEGAFVATGVSKGGMASVYFRRFFPDDVDATIAYVAPQSYGDADPRYLDFVAKLGSEACRDALHEAQRELLLRRPAMTMYMQAEAQDGFTYEDHLGIDRALETAVLELPFTFWQYGNASHCAEIPTVAATDQEWWDFINTFNAPAYWSDYQIELYEPYFFQAATQLGYPAYDETHVADLLLHPGVDVAATYVLPPKMPTLDPAVMPDIADWLASEGQRMMFVYGQNDPYTAAAFELGDATDSFRFTVPLGNHGAEILQLPASDRETALAALQAWTGVKPQPLVLPHAPRLRLAPPGPPPHQGSGAAGRAAARSVPRARRGLRASSGWDCRPRAPRPPLRQASATHANASKEKASPALSVSAHNRAHELSGRHSHTRPFPRARRPLVHPDAGGPGRRCDQDRTAGHRR